MKHSHPGLSEPRRCRRVGARHALGALALCAAALPAQAQLDVPAGGVVDLFGGVWDQGCQAVTVAGTLVLGAGGGLTGVSNVVIAPGGSIDISGARIDLAGSWTNQGSVVNTGGGVVQRVDAPGCAALGPLGPLNPNTGAAVGAPAEVTAVPTTGGAALGLLALALGWLGWRGQQRARGQKP